MSFNTNDSFINKKTQGFWVVLPAGGTSQRYCNSKNKLLEPLNGRTVIAQTVENLLKAPSVKGFVIVSHPNYQPLYQQALSTLNITLPVLWANGGNTRRDSVCNGLQALPDSALYVAVHDAARPLVCPEQVEALFQKVVAGQFTGGLLATPVTDTLKSVDSGLKVSSTVNRAGLWQAQTPQLFKTALLKQAHQTVSQQLTITDDVQLIEEAKLGTVCVVEGSKQNIKITTPEDLALATWYLNKVNAMC